MKPFYTALSYLAPLFFSLIISVQSRAQCPDGHPGGTTAYDTTIVFGTGITSTPVKFPQFDPTTGMVTCVRLCVTITGIVDTVAIENFSNTPQTGSFNYIRTDEITGPGLTGGLSNSITRNYGPYTLAPTDGVMGSGPDRVAFGRDTVLNEQLCRTVNDPAIISAFYGLDSVTYNYEIDVDAKGSATGGNASTLVLTSALVNFRFEYCTCPAAVLPLNIFRFDVSKITNTRAELKWSSYDNPSAYYHYEVEVSKNGRNFTSVGVVEKNTNSTEPYRFLYDVPNGEEGVYYFRIKQVYSNGFVRFTAIRQISLQSSATTKFSVFPNPSSGIVGIKFDTGVEGKYNIQVFNTQGQVVMQKDIIAAGESSVQVGNLSSGVYWLRLTDKKTQQVSVAQILIK